MDIIGYLVYMVRKRRSMVSVRLLSEAINAVLKATARGVDLGAILAGGCGQAADTYFGDAHRNSRGPAPGNCGANSVVVGGVLSMHPNENGWSITYIITLGPIAVTAFSAFSSYFHALAFPRKRYFLWPGHNQ